MNPTYSSDSRRHFLRQTGLGVALAAVAGPAAALPFTETTAAMQYDDQKKLGFAIVGLGKFAQEQMMPAFKDCKYARITALVSGSPDKAKKLAAEYGVDAKNIYNYRNFDSIKDNPAVDVVYIVLPVGLHAEYTIRAAKAGKHVLCEKPMANTEKDCQQMIDACQKAGKKLMIAYRAQYEPFNLEAIARIRKGELGKVMQITADHGRIVDPTGDQADTWRVQKKLAGGGSLMDLGIYSLNAARYLTGEEPVEVTALEMSDQADPRFKEVEDRIHFTLRFPSGILATCTSSYSTEGVKRYRVFGQKAWLDLDPATDYYEHKMVIGDKDGQQQPKIKEGNQFAAELDHMAECVLQNKTPKTPGEEGLKDIRLIMAIYEAARTGKKVKV
ncbi:Gfo/Idh/MocA family protein [Hymenobacter metallilatus]|uniref:Gfo/Idh/MocA family oxidoreductase n=1 Tax=Hymenobacter metallilatus TaxID=2493666 RepID=A0A428JLN5_9BACT|nr:Gfo/Idh/MocA family oxidoreductase [Hymenobacter metallilatus]RSK33911.1 gfo/Idh/MocA family oxidoreductase [Hymenobacter metallilatus]